MSGLSLFIVALAAQATSLAGQWQVADDQYHCTTKFAGGKTTASIQTTPGGEEAELLYDDPEHADRLGKPLPDAALSINGSESHHVEAGVGGKGGGREVVVGINQALLAALPDASDVKISARAIGTIKIQLRNISAARAMLAACHTQRLRTWGMDPMSWSGLAAPPKAVVTLPELFTANDYPVESQMAGTQGVVVARLIAGTNGRATQCSAVNKDADLILAKQTCRILMTRAKFVPAHDKQGVVVAAPYVTVISYRMTNG
jgi:hypothetical protein